MFAGRLEVNDTEVEIRREFALVPSWVTHMFPLISEIPSVQPIWEGEEPVIRGGGCQIYLVEYNTVLEKVKKHNELKVVNLLLLKTLLKAEGSLIRRVNSATDSEAARQLIQGAAQRVGDHPLVEMVAKPTGKRGWAGRQGWQGCDKEGAFQWEAGAKCRQESSVGAKALYSLVSLIWGKRQ